MKMNLPNKLTIFRVILVPVLVALLLIDQDNQMQRYIAVAVFIIASLTDLLDGKIARKYNLVTNFGKFMDPLADKLLVSSAMICLIETGDIKALPVVIIVGRDFIINGFRLIASNNGKVIAADMWGKVKTTIQMIMVIVLIARVNNPIVTEIGQALVIAAVVMTIFSLVDCLIKNKDVLKDEN